jgi:hypothetical protein
LNRAGNGLITTLSDAAVSGALWKYTGRHDVNLHPADGRT